jgi:hypothetical protein
MLQKAIKKKGKIVFYSTNEEASAKARAGLTCGL